MTGPAGAAILMLTFIGCVYIYIDGIHGSVMGNVVAECCRHFVGHPKGWSFLSGWPSRLVSEIQWLGLG